MANRERATGLIKELQKLLDEYSERTGKPRIVVKAKIVDAPVKAPDGGTWSRANVPAVGGDGGFTIIMAKSPIGAKDGEGPPRGIAFSDKNTAIVSSTTAGPLTLAHEPGHLILWRDPNAATNGNPEPFHSLDEKNVMHAPSPNTGSIDDLYYQLLLNSAGNG